MVYGTARDRHEPCHIARATRESSSAIGIEAKRIDRRSYKGYEGFLLIAFKREIILTEDI